MLKNRAGYLSEPLFVGFVGVSGFDKYVESGESFNLFNHGSDLFGKAVPVLATINGSSALRLYCTRRGTVFAAIGFRG